MNNKKTPKKLNNETSESIDGSLWTKNFVEIYDKIETKLTKIPYSFFSKCVKIARLANRILLIKVIKEKERIKRKSHFFLNSLSVDLMDIFSELL